MTTRGLRTLVVEDDFLVGESIKSTLAGLGCAVIGVASTVADARTLLADFDIDVALLDIKLGGETTVALARDLLSLCRPVVFVTGYSSPQLLPPDLRYLPRLQKPVARDRLAAALLEAPIIPRDRATE